jgi:glycosyltransferase involved in cell wall biosynthesis
VTSGSSPGGAPAELPTVSIVVPVLNDPDRLARCLAALDDQTYPAHLVEVVVVDNGSRPDALPSLPEDTRFRLLREPSAGSYAARNTGLAAANGEVLAFTDSDCTPHVDWVEQGVRAIAASSADAVGGAILLTFPAGAEPRNGPELYEAVHGFPQQRYVERDGFAATANMFARASAFERVGPFDADLQSGGDTQWGRRLTGSGLRLAYAPLARVDHPARSSWRELTRKSRRVADGLASQQQRTARGVVRAVVLELRAAARAWRPTRQPVSISWDRWRGARYAAAVTWVRLIRVAALLRPPVPRRDHS